MARKEKAAVSVPCLNPLAPGFVPAKPIQQDEYDPKEIEKLKRENRIIITLKENGWKLYAVKAADQWKVYTDGIREVSIHLNHIIVELTRLPLVPDNTMLIGEVVLYRNGKSDLSGVKRILNMRDPKKALQKQQKIGLLEYKVFCIAFWDSQSCFNVPYLEQLTRIRILVKDLILVGSIKSLGSDLAAAKKWVKKQGAEGLVLYDKEFISSYRLDGKDPERVAGCYKWKPELDDDFIVLGCNPSEKNSELVKDMNFAQFEKKTGKLIDCGKFGNFSRAERARLCRAKYPMVLKLSFTSRFPSGKLCEPKKPVFRTDKPWRHCATSQVFPKAEYLDAKKLRLCI